MLPLSKEQLQQVRDTGWLREVVFKTEPRVNKVRCCCHCCRTTLPYPANDPVASHL
jgi:hypothetical protein